MYKAIALVSLLVIVGLVNWSIIGKEKHLAEGEVVYLALAPVDPRSLMQGDYMALRFGLADDITRSLIAAREGAMLSYDLSTADGRVVVSLDDRKIGTFKNISTDSPLSANEILLHYRVRNGAVKLATNGFFFQEGHGEYYEPARYGQFRVDDRGELLLVAMYDEDLKKLGPKSTE